MAPGASDLTVYPLVVSAAGVRVHHHELLGARAAKLHRIGQPVRGPVAADPGGYGRGHSDRGSRALCDLLGVLSVSYHHGCARTARPCYIPATPLHAPSATAGHGLRSPVRCPY